MFKLAKKSDLLLLAKHYNISEVKSSMLKQEIKNILVQYFIDEDIFYSCAESLIVETQSDLKLRELQLKLELQEREMEREESMKKLEMEREREEREREKEERMKKLEMVEREWEEREREKEEKNLLQETWTHYLSMFCSKEEAGKRRGSGAHLRKMAEFEEKRAIKQGQKGEELPAVKLVTAVAKAVVIARSEIRQSQKHSDLIRHRNGMDRTMSYDLYSP
ncbi:golgin subfamily A member 6-like protein 22 [Mercenaria mercenaria]|uniref:golgin subfamily A member 6-like protein 22 n=1 Tax=Mercenaria mercenaria TaxID=6596 RepID=UPI00234EA979|nr:golgin subfamily A member 6-like protein 22 [Mercenaria mercenaria]